MWQLLYLNLLKYFIVKHNVHSTHTNCLAHAFILTVLRFNSYSVIHYYYMAGVIYQFPGCQRSKHIYFHFCTVIRVALYDSV